MTTMSKEQTAVTVIASMYVFTTLAKSLSYANTMGFFHILVLYPILVIDSKSYFLYQKPYSVFCCEAMYKYDLARVNDVV